MTIQLPPRYPVNYCRLGGKPVQFVELEVSSGSWEARVNYVAERSRFQLGDKRKFVAKWGDQPNSFWGFGYVVSIRPVQVGDEVLWEHEIQGSGKYHWEALL